MLEKDVWVVWALDVLFRQPDAPRYAFKGGTSLSKVYKVIDRFSEDVDVTIDPNHHSFVDGLNPTEVGVSKNKLKKRGNLARQRLPGYLAEILVPYLKLAVEELPPNSRPRLEIAGDQRDKVRIHYPSALERSQKPPYIGESVLLEFGARASTEPSVSKRVHTYLGDLAELVGVVELPDAAVRAMTVERTFWEKVTLAHFENARSDEMTIKERYARHWYDLHRLCHDEVALDSVLDDTAVLKQVLRVKRVHYAGKGVRYEDCGVGRLQLVPNGQLRNELKLDYDKMITANMFVTEPTSFDEIVDELAGVEERVNAHFRLHPISLI